MALPKIRIGKPISIRLRLTVADRPITASDDITVFVSDCRKRTEKVALDKIEDGTFYGTWHSSMCHALGVYSVTAWLNYRTSSPAPVDAINAFELVPFSNQETSGIDPNSSIVVLESAINIGTAATINGHNAITIRGDCVSQEGSVVTINAMPADVAEKRFKHVFQKAEAATLLAGDAAKKAEQAERAVTKKQDKLTAGDNITIEGNVISAKGGGPATINGYNAITLQGDCLKQDDDVFTIDAMSTEESEKRFAHVFKKAEAATLLAGNAAKDAKRALFHKQDKLIAGDNITITDNVISATSSEGSNVHTEGDSPEYPDYDELYE